MLISIYQHSLNLRPFFKPLFESGQAGPLATIKRTLFFNTTISDRFKPVLHSSARQGAIESPGLTAYVAYAQFSRPPCNTTLEKLRLRNNTSPLIVPHFRSKMFQAMVRNREIHDSSDKIPTACQMFLSGLKCSRRPCLHEAFDLTYSLARKNNFPH